MKENKKASIEIIILSLIIIFNAFYLVSMNKKETTNITYNEFLSLVEEGMIESVVISGDEIQATSKGADEEIINYRTRSFPDSDLVNRLLESNVTFEKSYSVWPSILSIVLNFLPILLIFWFYRKMFSGKKGIMGTTNLEVPDKNAIKSNIKFANVAGEDEAKESLSELVDFLHNPKKYTDIGARLPKGALLVGPPGTGKTLLAKAVAGEANVPFYSITGSAFVEMFVGVGASRVRSLFKQAKKNAPCIIFIDEIDAIGRSRESSSRNDERENTLNQLLSEMDGFDASEGIIILGATNRPEVLDKALLRPGRFDRRIIVENPDVKGREEILKVHSKNVKLADDIDFEKVALATVGVSGADLENIVNEAAIDAVKRKSNSVSQSDFMKAIEIVLVGKEKKTRVLSEKEKKLVSYHEIGHAVAAAVQKNTEPVQKITIIPRTNGALGFVMQSPQEEKYLCTEEELVQKVIILLAGRATEEVFFDTVTTGASNDIEQATQIARAMITQYGMSEKFGLVGFSSSENRYLSGRMTLECGDITAAKIDQEVISVLKKAYQKAKDIILSNREKIEDLATFLFEKETITGKEFMEIFKIK